MFRQVAGRDLQFLRQQRDCRIQIVSLSPLPGHLVLERLPGECENGQEVPEAAYGVLRSSAFRLKVRRKSPCIAGQSDSTQSVPLHAFVARKIP